MLNIFEVYLKSYLSTCNYKCIVSSLRIQSESLIKIFLIFFRLSWTCWVFFQRPDSEFSITADSPESEMDDTLKSGHAMLVAHRIEKDSIWETENQENFARKRELKSARGTNKSLVDSRVSFREKRLIGWSEWRKGKLCEHVICFEILWVSEMKNMQNTYEFCNKIICGWQWNTVCF